MYRYFEQMERLLRILHFMSACALGLPNLDYIDNAYYYDHEYDYDYGTDGGGDNGGGSGDDGGDDDSLSVPPAAKKQRRKISVSQRQKNGNALRLAYYPPQALSLPPPSYSSSVGNVIAVPRSSSQERTPGRPRGHQ